MTSKRSPPLSAPDYQAIFEAVPGLFLILEPVAPDFRIIAASDAYLRATMTAREDVLGRGLFDVFPDNPADAEASGVRNLAASLLRVLERRAPDAMAVQKYDVRRPAAEGGEFEERHWSPLNSPVLGPDGSILYIVHRVEDVTDLVRLRQRTGEQERITNDLRVQIELDAEERRRLLSLLQQVPAIVNYLRGPDLAFDIVHPKTLELLGGRQVVGLPLVAVLPERARTPFVDRVRHVLETGEPFVAVEEPERFEANGNAPETYWSSTYLAVRDSMGRIDGVLTFEIDVTEQVTARKVIEGVAAKSAEEAALKTNFLHLVSHEFRSPLTALSLQVSRMQREEAALNEPQRERVRRIAVAASHLRELVDSLLSYVRIESGRFQVKVERCDALALANEIVEELRPQAEEQRLTLRADGVGPAQLSSDPRLIRLILVNLVENALKFTDVGSVAVLTSPHEDGVRVVVEDTGRGIVEADHARVFEPFGRVESVRHKHTRGVGLGLALVKQMVTALGGRIELASKNPGTRFTVVLPSVDGATNEP